MPVYSDPRTDEMRREMTETFEDYEADYRSEEWCTVVYEDPEVVVIADHKGHEFSEWADEFGDDFSTGMHSLAESLTDYDWCASYPVVFDKPA